MWKYLNRYQHLQQISLGYYYLVCEYSGIFEKTVQKIRMTNIDFLYAVILRLSSVWPENTHITKQLLALRVSNHDLSCVVGYRGNRRYSRN